MTVARAGSRRVSLPLCKWTSGTSWPPRLAHDDGHVPMLAALTTVSVEVRCPHCAVGS